MDTIDSQGKHILVVEDDPSLSAWICDYLSDHDYLVSVANRGDIAIELIQEDKPDLVVLDIMLPEKDGFEVCEEVRRFYSSPILMMTACTEESDEVRGFELGADDYLAKPVRPRALLARIQALLRRNSDVETCTQKSFGRLTIDSASKSAEVDGKDIGISTNEFEVLWLLATSAGNVISRTELVAQLRGIDYDGFDRSIDIRVSRLRKKLEASGLESCKIKTVWGKGYLFVEESA